MSHSNFIFPDALQQGASQFESSAGRLKRKMWWKNIKVKLFLIIIITFHLVQLSGQAY